jgi:hypothetical protein
MDFKFSENKDAESRRFRNRNRLNDIRLTEEGKENNRADSTAHRNQPGGAELNRANATARRNQPGGAELNRVNATARRNQPGGAELNRANATARRNQPGGAELNRANVQRVYNAKKPYAQEWDYENPCSYCNCIWLKSELTRNLCCHAGKWCDISNISEGYFPQLEPLPDAIKHIAINECEYFTTKSAFYNGLFCSVITGVDNGRDGVGYERFNMTSCIALNGRVHHRLPDSTQRNCGMANFIYDGLNSHISDINNRRVQQTINQEIAEIIKESLIDVNPYVQDFQIIGEKLLSMNSDQPIPIYTASLDVQTHNLEVSILINQNPNSGVVYKFRTKDNQNEFLNANSDEVEPLCYPLLFPDGMRGWGSNLKRYKIHLMPYLAARLLQPEPSLYIYNQDGTKNLNVNRFNLMSRLTQYWLVDSKIFYTFIYILYTYIIV